MIREGLQSAIELNIVVHFMYVQNKRYGDALVLEVDNEDILKKWIEHYFLLCAVPKKQWSIKQWKDKGYTLTQRKSTLYKRTRPIPHLIHGHIAKE